MLHGSPTLLLFRLYRDKGMLAGALLRGYFTSGASRRLRSASSRYADAARLFRELIEAPTFPEFLTVPAYDMITAGAA